MHEAQARKAWPQIKVEPTIFAAFIAARLAPELSLSEALGRVRAADLYLACAVVHGDAKAIRELDAHFLAPLHGDLARAGVHATSIDDVMQALREHLLMPKAAALPNLAKYAGRGALRNWLRVTAVRLARRLVQGSMAGDSDDALVHAVAPGGDPELAYLKERHRHELRAAIEAALSELSQEDRLLFRHFFLDGLSMEQMGQLYGAHRATVWRRFSRARDEVMARTRASLHSRLALTENDLTSLIALVQSQLGLSIHRILSARAQKQQGSPRQHEGPGQTPLVHVDSQQPLKHNSPSR
ncbi:MAG: hypothetical protein HYZ27_09985 [Deltaproteobacteria bacterium]|nr:hypothetical protein [Deltaproteobacteria bacterium]